MLRLEEVPAMTPAASEINVDGLPGIPLPRAMLMCPPECLTSWMSRIHSWKASRARSTCRSRSGSGSK
jgi:hypothetical protein